MINLITSLAMFDICCTIDCVVVQDQPVILASQGPKDRKVSLAYKVSLETLALWVVEVKVVLLDHLDRRVLKAIRDLKVELVNQDQLVQLVILAFRVSQVTFLH